MKYSPRPGAKPVIESTGTTEESKAKRMLRQRIAQIATRTFIGPASERTRVSELAEALLRDYEVNGRKSKDAAERRWRLHLAPVFGSYRAADVTTEMMEKYRQARLQAGAKPATVNREMAVLKRMFRLGTRSTPPKVLRMPAFPQQLPERNVRTGFIESAHYDALADACGRVGLWLRGLFECYYTWGWRKQELLTLQVRQVYLEQRTVRLDQDQDKCGNVRNAPITNIMLPLLEQCIAGKQPDDYVFTHEDGSPIKDFRWMWKKACVEAGVGRMICRNCSQATQVTNRKCSACGHPAPHKYIGLYVHDNRRTAVREMVRNGVHEKVAMSITGHKSRSTFDRYNVVAERDQQEAARLLDEARQARAEQSARSGEDRRGPVSVQNGMQSGGNATEAVQLENQRTIN